MKFGLYTIKDELSEYGFPMAFQNRGIAERYFQNLTETDNMIRNNPSDFSLWKIGKFDTEKGEIEKEETPKLVIRAKGIKVKENE